MTSFAWRAQCSTAAALSGPPSRGVGRVADTIGLPVLSVYDLAVRPDNTKQISTKQLHAALSAAAGTDTECVQAYRFNDQ